MNNLKALRIKEKRTQEAVAVDIGLSSRGYRKIENGECLPSYPVIKSLERRFNQPIDYLLKPDEPSRPTTP